MKTPTDRRPAIVLVHPEIPPNTGNLIRVSAATGFELHLVKPLGFDVDDRSLRRAGLDYHDQAFLHIHENWSACLQALGCSTMNTASERRLFAMTTKGSHPYHEISFRPDDVIVMGCETKGLPQEVLEDFPPDRRLRIPMRPGIRSLNLANSASIVAYEIWRQNGFVDAV
ncbi:MAG: tRNA ((34)-2-O)-methyltransferase [Pseudomonadota bacterium]|jgi:tRNA (cytidine/uridine-2'-O-)-methyltransferase